MKQNIVLLLACLAAQIAFAELSLAERNAAENAAIKKERESWNAPFPPFRLIGNIHYVGASGISSFLITTPEGHILMDIAIEKTVPCKMNMNCFNAKAQRCGDAKGGLFDLRLCTLASLR